MQFIKTHWFGLIISLITLAFLLLFAIILISPKEDLYKRGFISCTENIVNEASSCQKGLSFCLIKALINGTECDVSIIKTGFSNWLEGKQEKPWSNYLFTPVLEDVETDENVREYYETNPNIKQEMQNLKEHNYEL